MYPDLGVTNVMGKNAKVWDLPGGRKGTRLLALFAMETLLIDFPVSRAALRAAPTFPFVDYLLFRHFW